MVGDEAVRYRPVSFAAAAAIGAASAAVTSERNWPQRWRTR